MEPDAVLVGEAAVEDSLEEGSSAYQSKERHGLLFAEQARTARGIGVRCGVWRIGHDGNDTDIVCVRIDSLCLRIDSDREEATS